MVTIVLNDKSEKKVLYTSACLISSILKAAGWNVREDFRNGFLYVYSK